MLLPRRLLPLVATLRTLPLTDRNRVLGTLILGAPGAGKTILESLFLLCDLLRGLPGCVLDPLGTLSEAFLFRLLCFLSEFPKGDDELLWQRLRYIEVGGDSITRFPIYYQRHGESLWEAGQRLITVLERANPQLVTGSALTWPATRRLAVNAGMILAALGYQLTKVEDLLFQTIEWEKSGKFDETIRRNPQAEPAVSYFRNYYLPLPRSEKSRLAGTFLDQVYMLTSEPTLREVFSGSSVPGIDWEEVEANHQIVILNFKGITNPTARSFAMQWIFESLYPHLQTRGRRNTPFVVTIDEFAHLAAAGTGENKPLADLFDEFLVQYMRNNREFLTLAFQSIDQVDERLRQTVFRLGTIITGRAGSMREARLLADQLFHNDIYRVQHYKKVWGKAHPPPLTPGNSRYQEEYLWNMRQLHPTYPYYVLDTEPEFMSLDDQAEEAAQTITKLKALEFLCRRAVREGEVSCEVMPFSIRTAITDPETGIYQFPDPDQDAARIAWLQHRLAARSGIPITTILTEQETRLTQGPMHAPRPEAKQSGADAAALPAIAGRIPEEGKGHQPSRLPDEAQPASHPAQVTQSLPTLTEEQSVFLSFLIAHPDTPISSAYKALELSGRKGNEIRERLRQQGFIQELEVRTGTTGAGRPMKCVIPTLHAVEWLKQEPPPDRGGAIHRHIQHLVQESLLQKGYSVRLEYPLPNGTIVDVHLEKGGQRIAVEIAIVSTPEREIAHIKRCMKGGYDRVFTLFADEELLERTEKVLKDSSSQKEVEKVRLLPLSKYIHIE